MTNVRESPAWIYEKNLVPAMFGPWAHELVKFAPAQIGEHVLDGACGTGAVARLLPSLVGSNGRVVGVDFDRQMLAVASKVAPDVEWKHGDLADMPFKSGIFHRFYCQQGLQFLPDRGRALADAHRVLRPGGQIALSVWSELEKCPGQAAVFTALGKLLGTGPTTPAGWSLASEKELVGLVRDAGFKEIRIMALTRESTYPSARRFVELLMAGTSKITREALAQVPDARKAAFVDVVVERLARYESGNGLEFPMESRLLHAAKT